MTNMNYLAFLLTLLCYDPTLARASTEFEADRYAVREAATKKIVSAGPRALLVLVPVEFSGLEARRRAKEVRRLILANALVNLEQSLVEGHGHYPWIDSLDPVRWDPSRSLNEKAFRTEPPKLLRTPLLLGCNNEATVRLYLDDSRIQDTSDHRSWPYYDRHRVATRLYVLDLLAAKVPIADIRAMLSRMYEIDALQGEFYNVPKGPDT